MCGISVLVQRAGAAGGVTRLLRMHEPVRHRGPDGQGFLVVDDRGQAVRTETTPPEGLNVRVGMAFRRLKILDLSPASDQPMSSPDGSCWIVFNGEIYNHRALKAELLARGRAFRTTGDTEVALAAYEAWGDSCFTKLDGMWAIVILDLARRRLLASRDRFGIKPLYWARHEGGLLLSSETKQILAARGGTPRAYAPLVAAFLRGSRYPCLEETFFEGVRSVPPATWFEVPLGDQEPAAPRFRSYWSLAESWCDEPEALSYAAARERFETVLGEAVASHSVADVTVGSLLSGGLDSSTLVRLLSDRARSTGRECPTFSFGFRGQDVPYCELRYVDALVRQERLLNYDTTLDGAWVVGNVGRVVRALEEPPLGLPALAQYRVFELCRAHGSTVVLDGEGADEVLAGYPYHQRLLLADRLRRLRLSSFTRELRAIAARGGRSSLEVMGEYFVHPLLRRAARPAPWTPPGYGERPQREELLAARADVGRDSSLVNRRLYFDVRWGNVKLVLGYTDKSAMAHSVEARVPFFDRALVELAFSLPDHHKIGGGDRKRILRDLARPLLPAEITERPDRMGFGTPDPALFRDGLWAAARQRLDGGFLESACFERSVVRRFVDDFAAGRHEDVRGIWRLFALASWRDEFEATIA
jgi:asparagine synthase (glutamine-hydrolysing)